MQDDSHGPSEEQPEPTAEVDRQEEQPEMDVSPPHHPVHNWRDVLVHLGIVTAGLFIALMLESVVEWVHHRNLVHEARHNIRLEIRHDLASARKDLGYLQSNLSRVEANIRTLQQMRRGKELHGTLTNVMEYESMDESAWHTARDTRALGYMPYDEVRRYSGLYDTINYVNNRAEALADTEFKALAPVKMGYDIKDLPDEQRIAMLRGNADAEVELMTLRQMLEQVDRNLSNAVAGRSTD